MWLVIGNRTLFVLGVGVYVFSLLLCLASCQYIERVFEDRLSRSRWLNNLHTLVGILAFVPLVNTVVGVTIAITCYLYEALLRP